MTEVLDLESDPLYAVVRCNVDRMPLLSLEKRARLALILQRGSADVAA